MREKMKQTLIESLEGKVLLRCSAFKQRKSALKKAVVIILSEVGKVIDKLRQEDNINDGAIGDKEGIMYIENYVDIEELKKELGIK